MGRNIYEKFWNDYRLKSDSLEWWGLRSEAISTDYFSFVSLFGEKLRSLALHKHQFEPYEIYNHDSLDNFIRGMASQPTQDMDSSFSRQVRHNTRRISHAMGPYICNLNLPSDTSNLKEFCELFRPMNWKVSWPAMEFP